MRFGEWTGARGFFLFLSGFGPRPVSGNEDETGVELSICQGDFERLPSLSLLSGRTAFKRKLQPFFVLWSYLLEALGSPLVLCVGWVVKRKTEHSLALTEEADRLWGSDVCGQMWGKEHCYSKEPTSSAVF